MHDPLVTAAGHLHDRWCVAAVVCRRVDDAFVALRVVGAGRAALARADEFGLAGRQIENIDLVGGHAAGLALEDQLRAVIRPIGLGVLAFERQLAKVAQVRFARLRVDRFAGLDNEVYVRNDWVLVGRQ